MTSIRDRILVRCPAGRYVDPPPEFVARELTHEWSVLGEGGTFLVLSDGGRWVLKLFKNVASVLQQFRSWDTDLGDARWTPFPGDEVATATWWLGSVIDNASFVCDNIRDRAAIGYLHLAPTIGVKSIAIDGEVLDLDPIPFVLQRRADVLLGDRLRELEQAGQREDVIRTFREWIDMICEFWSLGMATHLNFDENYGYVDGQLMLLDIGDVRYGRDAIRHDFERGVVLSHPAFRRLQQENAELAVVLRKEVDAHLRPRT